jgi:hypothetical protein
MVAFLFQGIVLRNPKCIIVNYIFDNVSDCDRVPQDIINLRFLQHKQHILFFFQEEFRVNGLDLPF